MRFKDLLEYDPEVGRAIAQAAYNIKNRAARRLQQPLKFSQMQDKVSKAVDSLNKFKDEAGNQNKDFKLVFQNFLNQEKKKAGIDGKMGFKYDTKKLQNLDGSYNADHIRKVLTDFYGQFRASAGISRKVAGIDIDPKDKFMPIGTIKKGSDGRDYEWQGGQWSDVKTGKMAGAKLP